MNGKEYSFEEVRAFLVRSGHDEIIRKKSNLQATILEQQEELRTLNEMMEKLDMEEKRLLLRMETRYGWSPKEYEEALSESAIRGINRMKKVMGGSVNREAMANELVKVAKEVMGLNRYPRKPYQNVPNFTNWTKTMARKDFERVLEQVLPEWITIHSINIKETASDPTKKGAPNYIADVVLEDGTKIHGEKEADNDGMLYLSQWIITTDGETFNTRFRNNMADYFDQKYLDILARYKKELDNFDITGHLSDDSRYWYAQEAALKARKEFYTQLGPEGKREAYEYYLKMLKKWNNEYPSIGMKIPSFSSFEG